MDTQLAGKVALVTGASQGIGRAIAMAFAQEGARVALLARNRLALDETLEMIGGSASGMVMPCDVTDPPAVAVAVEGVVSELGRLDVIVNNAGQRQNFRRLDQLDLDEWRSIIDANLSSVFYVTRAAVQHLLEQRSGSVVNVSSIAGPLGFPTIGSYSAAKAGVIGLTKTMAAEWSEFGVRVNSVAPGWTSSPMNLELRTDPANAELLETIRSKILLGRFADASEIAQAVVFLAGATGSYITGQTLMVDGGWGVV
jgi:NAD(P)-dependent dehydrogenase (short-subunit alcohol dehydrogenase family)